jgi:hypothetical protein
LGATIDWEDRLWYAALPVVGYLLMALSGILLASHLGRGSVALAAAILMLLITGAHNAWDITIWIVTRVVADRGTGGVTCQRALPSPQLSPA